MVIVFIPEYVFNSVEGRTKSLVEAVSLPLCTNKGPTNPHNGCPELDVGRKVRIMFSLLVRDFGTLQHYPLSGLRQQIYIKTTFRTYLNF